MHALKHELKFLLPGDCTPSVLRILGHLAQADPQHPRGFVESVYFDTRTLALLNEKINSDYLKTKVRVRWYPDAGQVASGPSFLELKRRIGTRRSKVRIETPYPAEVLSRSPLTGAELAGIPHLLRSHGMPVVEDFVPLLVVRYHRWRFVEPFTQARIALDTGILVPRTHAHFLPAANPTPLASAVLEVKSPHARLPERLAILTELGCRKSSFSKYAACYAHVAAAGAMRRADS